MTTLTRYTIVVVFSFPVAVFFALDVALFISELDYQIILASFFASWLISAVWAAKTTSNRAALSRICFGFSTTAFLLPVASIVLLVTEPSSQEWKESKSIYVTMVIVCLLIGGAMGMLGLLFAFLFGGSFGKLDLLFAHLARSRPDRFDRLNY